MRQHGRIFENADYMRADKGSKSSANKNDEAVFGRDGIMMVPSQINIVPVSYKVCQSFANEMRRYKGFAYGYVYGESQVFF